MTNRDEDQDRLMSALLTEPGLPTADARFADRVITLARYDLALRQRRHVQVRRLVTELAGLAGAVGTFAWLARADTIRAGAGDALAFASPAMLGVLVLAMWTLLTVRPGARA